MKFIIPLVLFFSLSFADTIITVHGLKNGLIEANPLFQNVDFGMESFKKMGISAFAVLFLLACYVQAKKENAQKVLFLIKGIAFALVCYYLIILLNNVLCFFQINVLTSG
ncbi:MAG: DUF5658 family protein [Candidatus Bathyarchaeota archaeon]|nr:DUF5658 family protein [Candidatus Bathyarchaeota archaeon]